MLKRRGHYIYDASKRKSGGIRISVIDREDLTEVAEVLVSHTSVYEGIDIAINWSEKKNIHLKTKKELLCRVMTLIGESLYE